MRTRKHQYSFASGEVSPEFFGRGDAVQFQTGLSKCENLIIKPQGSARTRPGTGLVSRCFNQASRAQLMPFTYDLDQAYAIEVGNGIFRFHSGGGTLLWATPINVGDLGTNDTLDLVTLPDGVLICAAPHGLVSGDEVRVTVSSGGTLPGGLASFTAYKVTVLDSRRLQFSTSAAYPTLTPLGPGFGSGFMRIFKTTELPREYTPAIGFVFSDVSVANDTIGLTGHNFEDEDRIRFVGGTPPAPLGLNVDYYVTNQVPNAIEVSLTPGGATIDLTTQGSGAMVCYRRYQQGELAFVPVNGGLYAAGTVIYAIRDHNCDLLYPTSSGNFYEQTGDGILTVPHDYNNLEVFDLNWDQSGDVITLVHPNHPERELKRLGALQWIIEDVAFTPSTAAPSPTVAETYGEELLPAIYLGNATSGHLEHLMTPYDEPGISIGTTLLYVSGTVPGMTAGQSYVVNTVNLPGAGVTGFSLRELGGGVIASVAAPTVSDARFAFTDLIADTNEYKVASVDANGIENLSSSTGTIINNLANPGASNVVSWTAITGASKYRVYKKTSGTGLFGLIGETDQVSFTDSDLPPDLTQTAPVLDADIGAATNYSRATARFDQSRCFAGSDLFPRRLFMSRKNTETDFSSRIPPLDDDRISVEVAAREAHVIRHIVPLGDLVLLTQLGEWRVFAINSDAITPTTIAVRPQSYIGSSATRPLVINNSLLFCAARGGHVREMGFQATQQGFVTGDLSLRAAHLFDGEEILSAAYQKAPVPVAWFVSTSGSLLGLTYAPEERIGGWHRHDTSGLVSGAFESVCVIPDGSEDRVYVTTRRTVNGSVVRSVERIGQITYDDVFNSPGVDAHQRYSGTGTGTLTITGGAAVGDTVTVTSSEVTAFSIFDVGKRLYVTTEDYVVEITAFVSQNVVTGELKTAIPVTQRGVALSTWAFGVKTITGLDLLEGCAVSVVRTDRTDKLATVEEKTVTNGAITLDDWATLADVGLQYNCDLTLPPVTLQADALGYGRGKAVNHAWIRVFEAAGLTVAAADGSFTDIPSLKEPGGLVTEESRALLGGNRSPDGLLTVRQSLPLPATIVSATIEVSVGE